MKPSKLFVAAIVWLLTVVHVRAAIEIEITKGLEDARPIAVVPFLIEGTVPATDVAMVVNSDMRRSGRFRPIPLADLPARPSTVEQVALEPWRKVGVEALVIGRVKALASGEYEVTFALVDVFADTKRQVLINGELIERQGNVLLSRTAIVPADGLRRYAHRIADLVYEALTGEKGAFSTKIAYVTVERGREWPYQLWVADWDGFNAFSLVKSKHPIMSPNWSPDGRQLAYVSFEGRRSNIVVQNVYTAERKVVSNFPGINGAPAWSPDGRKLAITLSKDGNPEIYVLDLETRALTRITRHWAIDTEPEWWPDGSGLVFTSDRGGSPQIYSYDFASGKTERLTFQGNYNASAKFSSIGEQMVLVHRVNGQFHIAVMDLQSRFITPLTETQLDESPSIAPNGSMVIYAAVSRGRRVLASVSTNGRFRAILHSKDGEIRAPAWSPFLN
ncbi:MAG: Tol-Pal system protein TolB [Gammaproteobacteria bacterium]|nr:MAG: Tol-Pal system protein TolB [Gammaproteobacteria bacterium]